jgi:hypothetical protein
MSISSFPQTDQQSIFLFSIFLSFFSPSLQFLLALGSMESSSRQTKHNMDCRIGLDVVIREVSVALELLSSIQEVLFIRSEVGFFV